MMKALGALLGLVLLGSGAQAQWLKQKYELSAQCRKQAAETFRKYWGSGISTSNTGQIIGKYENHYNYRLNKCFYLEISDNYERGKSPFRLMRLYDLHESRDYDLHESREIGAFVGTRTVFLERENDALFGGREGMQRRRGMASCD